MQRIQGLALKRQSECEETGNEENYTQMPEYRLFKK